MEIHRLLTRVFPSVTSVTFRETPRDSWTERGSVKAILVQPFIEVALQQQHTPTLQGDQRGSGIFRENYVAFRQAIKIGGSLPIVLRFGEILSQPLISIRSMSLRFLSPSPSSVTFHRPPTPLDLFQPYTNIMSNAASPRPASPSLVEIDKRGRPKHLTPTSPEYYTWYDEKEVVRKRSDGRGNRGEVRQVSKPGFGKAKRCYTCCTGSCSFFRPDAMAEHIKPPTNLTHLERAIGGLDAVLAGPVGELAAPLARVQENLRSLREQFVGGSTSGGGSGATGNSQ
ncbi:hypothetical protein DB88DRAFT_473170 [Papiliotrema laurentii]|uniref:Uncharacterized protein n=1 Tax=Papiliotrema laurentii TaxID=5418 RepID=A0AAD9CX02_PAPLA|nr:hypothetical protein DB88DRAFT_473170 [Papiliotrema laurentii]